MNDTHSEADEAMNVAENRLVRDVACRTCGYNLKSLAVDADCPECGAAVELSLHPDFLAFANPDWLKVVRSGVAIVFSGVALIAITFLATMILWHGFMNGVIAFIRIPNPLVMGSLVVCSVGAWVTAVPEPGAASKKADTARMWLRTAAVGAAVFLIISQTAAMLFPPVIRQIVINTMEFAGATASLLVMAAQLHWLETLSHRIPDPRGEMRQRVLKWTMPIFGLVWIAAVTARWARTWRVWFAFSTRLADVSRIAGFCFVIHWLAYIVVLAQFYFYIRREEAKARNHFAST